jgi:hypothetical protein
MKRSLVLALAAIFGGCMWPSGGEDMRPSQRAYVAHTMSLADLRTSVKVTGAQSLKSPGKIYVLGDYLYINEKSKGVHIFNNADPRNPKNLSFVTVPGSTDIAAKGSALYVDNAIDLVTLDVSDPAKPRLADRVQNALPPIAPTDGPLLYGNFNPNTEVVIEWKDTLIYQ